MGDIIIVVIFGCLGGLATAKLIEMLTAERTYMYMCSYHHKNGLGTALIKRHEKIRTRNDVVELQHHIEEEGNVKNVGLINYILLKK